MFLLPNIEQVAAYLQLTLIIFTESAEIPVVPIFSCVSLFLDLWFSCWLYYTIDDDKYLDVSEREKDAENPSKKLRMIYTCGTLRTNKQCLVSKYS